MLKRRNFLKAVGTALASGIVEKRHGRIEVRPEPKRMGFLLRWVAILSVEFLKGDSNEDIMAYR
jgi:hypothetical protein